MKQLETFYFITYTMEFNYSDYLVRLTFNPTDIIIRFEHNKTFRSYEQTFFERDYPETMLMGGLEFLGKLLRAAFEDSGDVKKEMLL